MVFDGLCQWKAVQSLSYCYKQQLDTFSIFKNLTETLIQTSVLCLTDWSPLYLAYCSRRNTLSVMTIAYCDIYYLGSLEGVGFICVL